MKISKKSWHYWIRNEMNDLLTINEELKPEPICNYVWHVFWGCVFFVIVGPFIGGSWCVLKVKEKFCPMTEWED